MAKTDLIPQHNYAPCDREEIHTRTHCTCYFANPNGGASIRCRNRADFECEHGQLCGECDYHIHEVVRGEDERDFVCVFCERHFHGAESQEVENHIKECANRRAVSRGMEPPFPVKNPLLDLDPRTLGRIVAQMFRDIREKQN